MYEYNYELSNNIQKQNIDLMEYEDLLVFIIQKFFQNDLIKITVNTDGYILLIKNDFDNAQKRVLGKKISTQSGLKDRVKVVPSKKVWVNLL